MKGEIIMTQLEQTEQCVVETVGKKMLN